MGEVKDRAAELEEQVCTVDTMDSLLSTPVTAAAQLYSGTTQPLKELMPLRR